MTQLKLFSNPKIGVVLKLTDDEKKSDALKTLTRLLTEYRTVSLATLNSQGDPQVSYTPTAVDSERNFYLFVSELSEHTQNLRSNGKASLMLIDDESKSKQLFARNRLTLNGLVTGISRDGEKWNEASGVYRERFGKFFDQLSQLRDFHMFCFTPDTARLVIGFGAAYNIELPGWENLELLTGK